MVNNKRGLVEKGQHKVQKMCLVSEKPSDLPITAAKLVKIVDISNYFKDNL